MKWKKDFQILPDLRTTCCTCFGHTAISNKGEQGKKANEGLTLPSHFSYKGEVWGILYNTLHEKKTLVMYTQEDPVSNITHTS